MKIQANWVDCIWRLKLLAQSTETIKIIHHARKSVLFANEQVWVKKGTTNGFWDVTMGSFDGAEICELVGLYLLYQLRTKFPNIDIGLYRDDGLGCTDEMPGPARDRTRKEIIDLFKSHRLDITLTMNLRCVDFLDVTLDLPRSTFHPYKKPNNELQYINSQSNHPPNILKQLPKMIEKRLSDLSNSEHEFDVAKNDYERALNTSGFNARLKYSAPEPHKRSRKRSIIWFNPPFNVSVRTDVEKKVPCPNRQALSHS